MRCDYFRLCYIFSRGGFYVDADEVYRGGDCSPWFRDSRLKLRPLCYDIVTDAMVASADFLGSRRDVDSWIFYVNNNPLIAPPFHPIIGLALRRATEILLSNKRERFDIQHATGPGNLTHSLVRHALTSAMAGEPRDFVFLTDWETVSTTRWSLGYRADTRNWRLWTPGA
jgi:hypothetical protein